MGSEICARKKEALCKEYKYLVLTMDGYASYVSFKALQIFRENNIIAVALPAHLSHRLQVLDVLVFSPFKNAVRNLIADRSISAKGERNDIYTLCKIIGEVYGKTVTSSNIINGFGYTGIWSAERRSCNAEAIGKSDISNVADHGSQEEAYGHYKELMKEFICSRKTFLSDINVITNESLSTTHGAVLT